MTFTVRAPEPAVNDPSIVEANAALCEFQVTAVSDQAEVVRRRRTVSVGAVA